MLNPLCLALSPVALAIVFGYSYTKRFTSLSHLVLGLALAIAPVGAWLAVRGTLRRRRRSCSGCAVLCWVAGFDTIYACQDADFDRASGLHSLPARLGVARALRGRARLPRGRGRLLLAALYALVPLHPLYLAGVAAVAGAARLRALARARGRPLARERGVLHRERLDQRRLPRRHRPRARLACAMIARAMSPAVTGAERRTAPGAPETGGGALDVRPHRAALRPAEPRCSRPASTCAGGARRRLRWRCRRASRVLDLCTGTGGPAGRGRCGATPRTRGVGVDLSSGMLVRGARKLRGARPGRARRAWSAATPSGCRCATARFDGALVAFGIRNVGDPRARPARDAARAEARAAAWWCSSSRCRAACWARSIGSTSVACCRGSAAW